MSDLTHNTRYRTNWRGQLILQVEERIITTENMGSHAEFVNSKRWRDAHVTDLQILMQENLNG